MKRKHIKTKRAAARDDSRHFERFMQAHNEEVARRETEEARAREKANEEFAGGYLAEMRKALGIKEET